MTKRWRIITGVLGLAILLRVAWSLLNPAPFAAPPVPLAELIELVDPELRYEPAPPNSAQNAWPTLTEAAEGTSRLSFGQTQVLERVLLQPASFQRLDNAVQAEEVFSRHRPNMDLVRRAIGLPECGVGELTGGSNPVVILRGLQSLVTLFCRRGTLRLHRGIEAEAVEDLITAHRLAERLSEAGGPLYYASTASSLLARAEREMRIAAMNPNLSEAGVLRLLSSLPKAEKLDKDFQRSLRSELYWFIRHEVMRLTGPGGNSQKEVVIGELDRDIDSGWRDVDSISSIVLEGHSKPYDRHETVRSALPIYRELLANTKRAWADRHPVDQDIAKLVSDWPHAALSGDPAGAPHVQDAIHGGKTKILASANPYGRIALWYFIPVSDQTQATPFRNRADLEATRLVLALRAHELRTGRLPEKLEGLIQAKLIPAVPADPFGGKAYGYDPARRRIWSRGKDGIDGGGQGGASVSMTSPDLVWTLDPVQRIKLPDANLVVSELERRRASRRGNGGPNARGMVQPLN